MQKIGLYLGIFLSLTLVSGILARTFQKLEDQYFSAHKKEMTRVENVTLDDGSVVTNYHYATSPYAIASQFFAILWLVFPLFAIPRISRLILLHEITVKQYLLSSFLPVAYSILFIAEFFILTDKSLGWEYDLGKDITYAYAAIIVIVSAVKSGMLLYRNIINNK